eukprot:gnl/Chilomastix_caulleri/1063.p2 GENE.gnl/Chilomastix_caulleri/1063~~gnl/Chilomastix_caulleri/1063.p2  ORF type:complete len:81 (+),score=3.02 gnl/Chilomastix_caulleri/1063:400-642(+)
MACQTCTGHHKNVVIDAVGHVSSASMFSLEQFVTLLKNSDMFRPRLVAAIPNCFGTQWISWESWVHRILGRMRGVHGHHF